ncbi:MAG: NAD(P)-binding protein [Planctomycetota bacterium]|jgi:NADPH-dependent glutamate synthase beta subunit-like oxidoreductase
MAIKKKKKRKKKRSYASSAGSAREQSPLRPKYVEKMPPCRDACPSGNRIREFVTVIAQAERAKKPADQALEEAWHIYTDTSPFPAVCGRVCPHPCEEGCNRKELDGAVNINKTERSVGDYGLDKSLKLKTLDGEAAGSGKVAVVGAGPGGISCAYQLARRGYEVTVFEAADKPGGMLLWGIPRYRLPAQIIEGEIQKVLDLGVQLKCNTRVGTDVSLDDLKKEFQAVFVAIGAHTGLKLRVEGEDAENVLSGVEFLNRFNRGEKIDVGDNVIVVGGGNTAIDAARVSRRLGAVTTILYRRTRKEMPANEEEIEEALEEGVKLEYLAAPIGFNKDGDRITTMKCIRMELGEPDASGRRRPVPIEGSEFEIPASYVIPAISQAPDFTGFDALIEGRDWIKVDEHGASIKAEGIWAGGDAVNLDLVTTAVGHGRRAAEAIDRKFKSRDLGYIEEMPLIKHDKMRLDHYEKKERGKAPALPPEERVASLEVEVNQGFSPEALIEETRRCMSCGYCFDCEKCWMFCQDQAVEKPMEKYVLYKFKLENCTGCKKCAEECPCTFIDML